MVVVDFDYSDFKKILDMPKDKIIAGLSEIGAPTEVNTETGKIYVELTPNRPDWYSMEGLARALRSYYKKENEKYSTKKADVSYVVKVDESVSKIRPYTACAVVKNLKFDGQRIRDSVLLQEKLYQTLGRKVKKFGIGIYPLKEIEFPIKYTTMKPKDIVYIPLNCEKEMSAAEILQEHPKGKEHGHIIEKYDRYPVFVDRQGRIMALIPIVNSAKTGKIDENTKDVFIEVSGIDKMSINQALNIIACSFADIGGDVYEVIIDYGKQKNKTPDLEYKRMKFDFKKASKVLGVEIKQKEGMEMLKQMGYENEGENVLIPPYRADVMGEIDIIEDLAIAYGYNKFEPTLPNFFSAGSRIKRYDSLDSVMRGLGFVETTTSALTNKKKLERLGEWGSKVKEIKNPASEDYTVLRPTIIGDMLEVFVINKMRGLPQKFYEIGLVYEKEKTKTRMCFGVCDKNLGFSDVRGYLQSMGKELGVTIGLKESKNSIFESPYSSLIMIDGKERGVFGKVSERVLSEFRLETPAFIGEIELD